MRRWAKSGRLLPDHRTLGGHRRYDEDRLATVFHKNSRSLKVHTAQPLVRRGTHQRMEQSDSRF